MHRLQDLVRLHRQGQPNRAISRLLRMGRNTVARYRSALLAAGLLDGNTEELPGMEELRAAVDTHAPSALPPQQRSSIERWLPIIDEKHAAGVKPTAIYRWSAAGSLRAAERCSARDVAAGLEAGPGRRGPPRRRRARRSRAQVISFVGTRRVRPLAEAPARGNLALHVLDRPHHDRARQAWRQAVHSRASHHRVGHPRVPRIRHVGRRDPRRLPRPGAR